MKYFTSYVPIMKPATILHSENGEEPKKNDEVDTLEFVNSINPGDELWLAMGSTNASVALGAQERGARVFQLSFTRAKPYLGGDTEEESEGTRRKTKIKPEDVWRLSREAPGIFYPTNTLQSEVLAVISAWQELLADMEARKAYANRERARIRHHSIITGQFSTAKELDEHLDALVGAKDPSDPMVHRYLAKEKEDEGHLKKALHGSRVYRRVFEPIQHMGPRVAARFITGIERIERFPEPGDLMIYAGMMGPRGGPLPSRKRSAKTGEPLARSSVLNNACYMFQEQMFKWGVNSPYGQALRAQIIEECCSGVANESPYKACEEARKKDKERREQHAAAVKRGRIGISRKLLREIYDGWTAVMNES